MKIITCSRTGLTKVIVTGKYWRPPLLVYTGASKGWEDRVKSRGEGREKRKTDKDLVIDNGGGGQRMNKKTSAAAGKFDEDNKIPSETRMGEDCILPRQESKDLDSNYANNVYKDRDMLVPTLGPKSLSSCKLGRDQHSLGVCSMRKRKRSIASLDHHKMVMNAGNNNLHRRRKLGSRVFPGRGGFTKFMPMILARNHGRNLLPPLPAKRL